MNDDLLQILLRWRALLVDQGLAAPPEGDLRVIAAAGRDWPSSVDLVTDGWRDNIEYLRTQKRFGVNDPIANATTGDLFIARPGLSEGTAAEQQTALHPPEPAAEPVDDTELALGRLRDWLERARAANPDDADLAALSPHRLRPLVNQRHDPSQVLGSYGLSRYTAEVAAALSGRTEPATGRHESEEIVAPATVTERPGAESLTPPAPPELIADRGADAPRAVAEEFPRAVPAPPRRVAHGPEFDVDVRGFAAYDYSRPSPEPMPITTAAAPDKGVVLTWPEPADDAAVHLYRVVAGDEDAPYSPDSARLVDLVASCDAEDSEPFTHAVRHYQVWCNEGATDRAARLGQPYLIACATVVSPVINVDIHENNGSVIGHWDAHPGTRKVQIYRIPRQGSAPPMRIPEFRIFADQPNLSGFQDDNVERGKKYLYQIIAEATVDRVVQLAAPVTRDVTITPVLKPVTDLEATLLEGPEGAYLDMVWTPPAAGTVAVYFTPQRPSAALENSKQAEAALAGAGLTDETRLRQFQPAFDDGRTGMRRVAWPDSWSRGYLTPVTLFDGVAFVGSSLANTRVPPVGNAVIRQRVDEQMVTFGWPQGAAAVWGYLTQRGYEGAQLTDFGRRADSEITAEGWERQGGMHLNLGPDGCALHLFAVSFEGGKTFASAPAVLDYPGLRKVSYRTTIRRRALTGRPTSVSVRLMSDYEVPFEIGFSLVYHPSRFPLHLNDGRPLALRRADDEMARPEAVVAPRLAPDAAELEWVADLEGIDIGEQDYYLRLFHTNLDPGLRGRIAVLDPPIHTLRLRKA